MQKNGYLKEKVLIWGAGKQSELLYNLLRVEGILSNVVGIIDKSEGKWGSEWHGFTVASPDLLHSFSYDRVVISVWNWHLIFIELSSRYGIRPESIDNCAFILRQRFLEYYENISGLSKDMQTVVDHVKSYPLDFINYDFAYDHYQRPVEILDDQNYRYYIAVILGRRMYLPKSKLNTDEKAKNYVRSLLLEQDIGSPHRYLSDDFYLNSDACVLDIGAAEGIFTLLNMDRIGKAYLVESDEEWIRALKLTFADVSDKVEIIPGFVSDRNEGNCITIDSIVEDRKVDFIKMDIEGAEIDALKGARTALISRNIDVVVCSYHYPEDYDRIYRMMESYGYDDISHSEGYLTPIRYDMIDKTETFPRLSRGILRGRKHA